MKTQKSSLFQKKQEKSKKKFGKYSGVHFRAMMPDTEEEYRRAGRAREFFGFVSEIDRGDMICRNNICDYCRSA